jgi:hypothetical protein
MIIQARLPIACLSWPPVRNNLVFAQAGYLMQNHILQGGPINMEITLLMGTSINVGNIITKPGPYGPSLVILFGSCISMNESF